MRELSEFIRAESASGKALTLASLGARANMSPFHLQHKFKAAIGVTPKAYMDVCRMEQLKENLRNGESVTTAIFESGYGASSRVYERSNGRLGMTPKSYANGGSGVQITYAFLETEFGLLLLAATDRGLCLVRFGDSRTELAEYLRQEFPEARLSEFNASYVTAVLELDGSDSELCTRPESYARFTCGCESDCFCREGLEVSAIHTRRRSANLHPGGACDR